MSDYDRREFLAILAAVPLAPRLAEGLRPPLPAPLERAARAAEDAIRTGGYRTLFFTPEEWETVRVLADAIIPPDAEAGGATDAGVPEFIDFTVDDRPELQVPLRGGLRWLDVQCGVRFGQSFVQCTPGQRETMLDLIAWGESAPSELSQGVAFFNRFRDLVASGYFTSRIGLDYLGYLGNTYVSDWNGCPGEVLEQLGVRYPR